MSTDRQAPHVVMLVTNDVTGDSRVQKSASAVAAAGYRVTVVGLSLGPERTEEQLGDVLIVRVPVRFPFRKAAKAETTAEEPKRLRLLAIGQAEHRTRIRRRRVRIAALRLAVEPLDGRRPGLIRRAFLWARIALLRRAGDRDRARTDRRLARLDGESSRPFGGRRHTWHEELPVLVDFLLGYAPVVRGLRPDIIHAHDYSTIAIAADVASLLRAEGNPVKWLYDAHEYVRGLPRLTNPVLRASVELEGAHIRDADAVITVSPVLSRHLAAEHRLREEPAVVLNAPPLEAFDPGAAYSVRRAAGVAEGIPLLVYSGNVKPERGVDTLVRALPEMPGVHCAVVARTDNPTVLELKRMAAELDCADRLHVVPYVPADKVSTYLRTADVGVHTIRRSGNADIALPNKMFEYFQALLPMVVSDARAMKQFTEEHGTGEVFEVGDASASPVRVRRCLRTRTATEPAHRSGVPHRYSWEAQARELVKVYERLVPPAPRPAAPSRVRGC